MLPDEQNDYSIPLQQQTVFGAGIRRRKIKFVASSNDSKEESAPEVPILGAGERYLAIVLNNSKRKTHQVNTTLLRKVVSEADHGGHAVCDICRLPLNLAKAGEAFHKPHETSLAHQVSLEHSYPRSHLDRNRQGLKYLSSYGWDPDKRLGLGASGTGIRIPIKPKPKNDTLGLGSDSTSPANKVIKPTARRLDAKQTRRGEVQAQKERERLRSLFYQHEDVDNYLGLGG